jgi:hypothetical protein
MLILPHPQTPPRGAVPHQYPRGLSPGPDPASFGTPGSNGRMSRSSALSDAGLEEAGIVTRLSLSVEEEKRLANLKRQNLVKALDEQVRERRLAMERQKELEESDLLPPPLPPAPAVIAIDTRPIHPAVDPNMYSKWQDDDFRLQANQLSSKNSDPPVSGRVQRQSAAQFVQQIKEEQQHPTVPVPRQRQSQEQRKQGPKALAKLPFPANKPPPLLNNNHEK